MIFVSQGIKGYAATCGKSNYTGGTSFYGAGLLNAYQAVRVMVRTYTEIICIALARAGLCWVTAVEIFTRMQRKEMCHYHKVKYCVWGWSMLSIIPLIISYWAQNFEKIRIRAHLPRSTTPCKPFKCVFGCVGKEKHPSKAVITTQIKCAYNHLPKSSIWSVYGILCITAVFWWNNTQKKSFQSLHISMFTFLHALSCAEAALVVDAKAVNSKRGHCVNSRSKTHSIELRLTAKSSPGITLESIIASSLRLGGMIQPLTTIHTLLSLWGTDSSPCVLLNTNLLAGKPGTRV